MALQIRIITLLVLSSAGVASAVTPVEKVISLLEGLKADIEKDAKAEATTYGKFACFCKDTTKAKSKSVTDGQDRIDSLSAAIADNTATKVADETKEQNLKKAKESLSADLEENIARCAKEKAEYEALAADLNKALTSLNSAIKAMADKKEAIGKVKAAALLEVHSGIQETLELADAMGLIAAPKQKAVSALLQQSAPEEYEYHSSDIVALLKSLKTDFTKEKETLDTEFGKTEKSCTDLKKSLAGKIETNGKETESVNGKIEKLGTDIADARGNLVEAQSLMKDDEQYLKDLTTRCETSANEFDQRSSMRGGEIEAISTALKVLGDRVKGADEKVNKRAFMQQAEVQAVAQISATAKVVKTSGSKKQKAPWAPVISEKTKAAMASQPEMSEKMTKKIETSKAVVAKTAMSFLQRVQSHAQNNEETQEAQEQQLKEQVAIVLRDAGIRLKSTAFQALAMRIAADPFKKVKDLIQGLIERLITEAAAEATKKGFCDTEMGKATRERNYRWTQVKQLTAFILAEEARKDALVEEIAELKKDLETVTKALEDATKLRKEQKADNAETLSTAREGLEAVNEALLILKSFYKQAAKGEVLLQASPVDEDTDGAGFSGAYKGNSGTSNTVLALLETIVSDFERTIRKTESAEDTASKEYVKFERTSKADIASKETKIELNTQELNSSNTILLMKKAECQNNVDLVDESVETLMELKPTCVNTGMTYAERVSKREEEIKALNNAVCLLDTNKVEEACK